MKKGGVGEGMVVDEVKEAARNGWKWEIWKENSVEAVVEAVKGEVVEAVRDEVRNAVVKAVEPRLVEWAKKVKDKHGRQD
jgi:hypothetical protein